MGLLILEKKQIKFVSERPYYFTSGELWINWSITKGIISGVSLIIGIVIQCSLFFKACREWVLSEILLVFLAFQMVTFIRSLNNNPILHINYQYKKFSVLVITHLCKILPHSLWLCDMLAGQHELSIPVRSSEKRRHTQDSTWKIVQHDWTIWADVPKSFK